MSIFSWRKGETGSVPTATQQKQQAQAASDPARKTVREPNYHEVKRKFLRKGLLGRKRPSLRPMRLAFGQPGFSNLYLP